MNTIKKSLILLFLLTFLVAFSANTVFAAEQENIVEVSTLAQLTEALAAENDAQILITQEIQIPAGETVALDLNGKTVTAVHQKDNNEKHIYAFRNLGVLTISDSKGTGSITARGIYNGVNGEDNEGVVLTINGAKIVSQDWNGGACVWGYGAKSEVYLNDAVMIGNTGVVSSEGYLQIDGGSYTCHSGISDEGVTLSTPTYNIRAYNGLKITDGVFTSRHGVISVSGGENVIENGSFTILFKSAITSNVVYVYSGAELTILDGEFISDDSADIADSGAAVVIADSASEVTIHDGTFVGINGMVSGNSNTVLKGGAYSTVFDYNHYGDIEGYVEPGSLVKVDGVTYMKFENASPMAVMARIGEEYYATVQEAIADAKDNDTVELLDDFEQSEMLVITNPAKFILEGNGNTISGFGIRFEGTNCDVQNVVFENCAGKNWGVLEFVNSKATVSDCFFSNNTCHNVVDVDGDMAKGQGLSEVVVSNCVFTGNTTDYAGVIHANDGASTLVKNCDLVSNTCGIGVIYIGDSASVIGCYFEGNTIAGTNANKAAVLAGPYSSGVNTVVINNNVFLDEGFPGVWMEDWTDAYGTETSFDISGNYWADGAEPELGADYGITGAAAYALKSYAEDYIVAENATGAEVVLHKVAKIVGGEEYATLDAAIEAATETDVIALIEDIDMGEDTVAIPRGKIITIDLAGFTLSGEQKTTVTGNDHLINNRGVLTIKDSSEAGTGKITFAYTGAEKLQSLSTISNEQGTLTVQGGTIENTTDRTQHKCYDFVIDNLTNSNIGVSTVNMEGGKLVGNYVVIRQFANSTKTVNALSISGGVVEGPWAIWLQNPSSYANYATMTITGGIIDGKVLVDSAELFEVAFSGGSFAVEVEESHLVEGYSADVLVDGFYLVHKHDAQTPVSGKDATCTDTGLTDGKNCSVCGKVMVEQTEIAANGHSPKYQDEVAATYAEDGMKAHYRCEVCAVPFADEAGETPVTEESLLIPRLIKLEEEKAEISPEAVDNAIVDAIASGNVTEVVIDLNKIAEDSAAEEETPVAVVSAQLPVAALEQVAQISEEATLTMTMAEATVTMDAATMEAVVTQAEGDSVTLKVEQIPEESLSQEQQAAIQDKNVVATISAQIICDNTQKAISDFKGGNVKVEIPFTPEEGYKGEDYMVVFIADDGTVEEIETVYVDGKLVVVLEHFSEYAIVNTNVVPTTKFVDVKLDAYYADSVLWAEAKGITTGKTATTFLPEDGCTRSQIVTFLWRAYGCPEPTATENPFTDVHEDAYYYKAVLWAFEKGITTGKTATTFEPKELCTRAQAVTFLWRAAGKPKAESVAAFADVPAGAYYADAVAWAVEEEITLGKTETTFVPDETCLRAQIVTFLYRFMA